MYWALLTSDYGFPWFVAETGWAGVRVLHEYSGVQVGAGMYAAGCRVGRWTG